MAKHLHAVKGCGSEVKVVNNNKIKKERNSFVPKKTTKSYTKFVIDSYSKKCHGPLMGQSLLNVGRDHLTVDATYILSNVSTYVSSNVSAGQLMSVKG